MWHFHSQARVYRDVIVKVSDDPTFKTGTIVYNNDHDNSAKLGAGTGYISATSQNPDACYRWLTYIAQHVDIFGAMPARLSQITDPNFAQTFGDRGAEVGVSFLHFANGVANTLPGRLFYKKTRRP